jgi:hypothetical protein
LTRSVITIPDSVIQGTGGAGMGVKRAQLEVSSRQRVRRVRKGYP